MARTLSAAMVTEVTAAQLKPIFLVDLVFDTDPLYAWSGYGTLSWNGNDYVSAGELLQISAIEETAEIKAAGIQLVLSGVPSSLLSVALGEDYQGRTARLYIGALDASTPPAVVVDPASVFVGRMDVM